MDNKLALTVLVNLLHQAKLLQWLLLLVKITLIQVRISCKSTMKIKSNKNYSFTMASRDRNPRMFMIYMTQMLLNLLKKKFLQVV